MIRLKGIGRMLRGGERPAAPAVTTFAVDLQPGFDHREVHVTLSLPPMPSSARDVRFLEHVVDRARGGEVTDTVIACCRGGVVLSDDLGESWRHVPIAGLDFRIRNVFTTTEGLHLIQEVESPGSGDILRLAVCDADWRLLQVQPLSSAPWHGSRSIDEADGVIMFAEYPGNYKRGVPNEPGQTVDHDKNSRVFRSTDGGRNWAVAFEIDWREIRHFHTIMADPHVKGQWWLSSGDTWTDCRVWRSDDDGLTWRDFTTSDPDFVAPAKMKGRRQAAYRYTDAVLMPDGLLWGSDDWLGGRAGWNDPAIPPEQWGGSRVFWVPRAEPLVPELVGYIGNPVRSIIDVGPAWVFLTEGKHPELIAGAQVCLLSKAKPMTLQQIHLAEIHGGKGSGFTYSVASPAARNGRFFTQRGPRDVFDGGARILQWDIRFD